MSTYVMFFAVPDGTGSMKMLAAYAQALLAAGHQVLLAHGDSTAKSATIPPAGRRLLDSLEKAGLKCQAFAGFRKTYSKRLENELRQFILDHQPDAMVGFHQLDRKYALRLAPQTQVPCIISAQNKHVFWGSKPVAWLKEWVYKGLLKRNATSVICTSETIHQELRQRFQIDAARCKVIPNGIDVPESLIDPKVASALRRDLGVEENEVMFVNTGRIDVQKGQDILLEAWDQVAHDHWRMFFVGSVSEGPNSERMKEYEAQLFRRVESMRQGERVTFLGWRDDVRELLAAADCYVHPARWEGWPLAVCEGMAASKPIIASDCVGSPIGFVNGEHGFMVASENSEALARALHKFLEIDRGHYPEMGRRCRQIAEQHYDLKVIGQQVVEHLESVVDATQSRPETVDGSSVARTN